MLKPVEYQHQFVALRNVPYRRGAPGERDNRDEGVLGKGKTVWVESGNVPARNSSLQSAFVEGLGIISLDPHLLVPLSRDKEKGGGGAQREK